MGAPFFARLADLKLKNEFERAEGGAWRDEESDQLRLLKPIRRIVHAIDMRSRALERLTGLTIPQVVLLNAVADLGEVTTATLANHADLSPATVVVILDKLEARGLIERYRSRADRRVVHARLTSLGLEKLNTAPPLLDGGFLERFGTLSQKERQVLADALARFASLMLPHVPGVEKSGNGQRFPIGTDEAEV